MTSVIGNIASEFEFKQVCAFSRLEQHEITVYGRTYPQPRLVEWFGPCDYHYSSVTLKAQPLRDVVLKVWARVQDFTGVALNSCLTNFYRDGADTVGWHSDDEPLFDPRKPIVSVSFGADRQFKMRLKRDTTHQRVFTLSHGDILLMPPGTQSDWQHCVPRTKRPVGSRINLTFRQVR
jgi:alkylated DNA repair dioxygenase AlkB